MQSTNRKTIDELMNEAIWTRKEASRILRIDPRTLDRYLFHQDPKKRLSCMKIGNTVRVERTKVLEYFRVKGAITSTSSANAVINR